MSKFLPLRIFDLTFGQTASGKSVSIARVVKQMHKETGKRARIIVGDGSLAAYEPLINAGIASYVEFGSRPWPFDVTQRILSGWVSQEQANPQSPLRQPTPEEIAELGMTVIEGASVMSSYLMGGIKGGLAWQSGQGIKLGQDSPVQIFNGIVDAKTGKLLEGPGTQMGGNPIAHYNITQRTMVDLVQLSKNLPGHVIWTAHESTNDPEKDKLVKELVIGPEVAGKALTVNFQRLFADTLHFMSVAKRVKSETKDELLGVQANELDVEYRIYTRDHFAPQGAQMARYKARTINVGNDFPQYFSDDKPGMQLIRFYEALHEYQSRMLED